MNATTFGLEDARHEFYRDGRHQSLNEIYRDQVTGDLIRRLNSGVARVAPPSLSPPLAR